MPFVNVEGIEYDVDKLSDTAKQMMQSIQFVDVEVAKLAATTAAMQLARKAYFNGLKQALAEVQPDVLAGDTLKLS